MLPRLTFLLAGITLFPFFLSAQTDTTYTVADTVRARELLELAQRQIDSARYDAALANLEMAGAIYKAVVGEESGEWARVMMLTCPEIGLHKK